jgi:hypothetical protein
VAPIETKLCLIEIAALYDGANNGNLKFGVSDAQRKLRTTRRRAEQALTDLNDIGLAFDWRDGGKRRFWSLAHLRCDVTGRAAMKPWETNLPRRLDEHDNRRRWDWTREELQTVIKDCALVLTGNTCARFSDQGYAEDFISRLNENWPAELTKLSDDPLAMIASRINDWPLRWDFDHPPFRFHERANMPSKFSPEEREAFEARLFKKTVVDPEDEDIAA